MFASDAQCQGEWQPYLKYFVGKLKMFAYDKKSFVYWRTCTMYFIICPLYYACLTYNVFYWYAMSKTKTTKGYKTDLTACHASIGLSKWQALRLHVTSWWCYFTRNNWHDKNHYDQQSRCIVYNSALFWFFSQEELIQIHLPCIMPPQEFH